MIGIVVCRRTTSLSNSVSNSDSSVDPCERITAMSRENPNVTKTVTATLSGEKGKYALQLVLSCIEMWDENTEPVDVMVLGEKLAATNPEVVEDGDYQMEYNLGGRRVTRTVQISSAKLDRDSVAA
jgi:hypothetical protein